MDSILEGISKLHQTSVVAIETFEGDLAAALDLVHTELKPDCRYERFSLLSLEVGREWNTSHEHSLYRKRFFVYSGRNCLLHLDYLESFSPAYIDESFKDIVCRKNEGHIHLEGGQVHLHLGVTHFTFLFLVQVPDRTKSLPVLLRVVIIISLRMRSVVIVFLLLVFIAVACQVLLAL